LSRSSNQRTKERAMYRIVQEEPEGWQKAFAIYFGDKRITHASFLDAAQETIKTLIPAA
jgi:hypothetical protein